MSTSEMIRAIIKELGNPIDHGRLIDLLENAPPIVKRFFGRITTFEKIVISDGYFANDVHHHLVYNIHSPNIRDWLISAKTYRYITYRQFDDLLYLNGDLVWMCVDFVYMLGRALHDRDMPTFLRIFGATSNKDACRMLINRDIFMTTLQRGHYELFKVMCEICGVTHLKYQLDDVIYFIMEYENLDMIKYMYERWKVEYAPRSFKDYQTVCRTGIAPIIFGPDHAAKYVYAILLGVDDFKCGVDLSDVLQQHSYNPRIDSSYYLRSLGLTDGNTVYKLVSNINDPRPILRHGLYDVTFVTA